eukprot:TRINITY_DN6000_c0_g1_i2.p1 TRINITY_DN6000_c0_g1~~TRINITY_DN6000_c0_g1_i2.p1  ORF type:complete len:362 (+),score=81.53 TRINITY_DN6000_c0_g1_i2:46-1086(+)
MTEENLPTDQNNHRFEAICNFRDLSTSSGGRIKPGKIYRMATPSEATPADIDYFVNKMGVKTILDLRTVCESDDDAGDKPLRQLYHRIPESHSHNLAYVNRLHHQYNRLMIQLPILPSNVSFLGELSYVNKAKLAYFYLRGEKDRSNAIISDMMVKLKLQGLYRLMLRTSWKNILRALQICSNVDYHPIVIHCSQGKDRTGMLTAMILNCCNVPANLVQDDYHRSEMELERLRLNPDYMARNFKKAAGLGLDMTSWMLAPVEALTEVKQWIVAHYGSVSGYLEWIGFNPILQENLGTLLMEHSHSVEAKEAQQTALQEMAEDLDPKNEEKQEREHQKEVADAHDSP